jgi:predicted  nucleic acid-binding Zn-ribbon protein
MCSPYASIMAGTGMESRHNHLQDNFRNTQEILQEKEEKIVPLQSLNSNLRRDVLKLEARIENHAREHRNNVDSAVHHTQKV